MNWPFVRDDDFVVIDTSVGASKINTSGDHEMRQCLFHLHFQGSLEE